MVQETLNFFRGHPSATLLPSADVLKATTSLLSEFVEDPLKYDTDIHNQHPLTYGTDPGNLSVRKTIAAWNDRVFGRTESTDPDTINLTGGASYGILNILSQCTSAQRNLTRRVFIVTPTYYLINGAFIDSGFGEKLTGITESRHGELDLKYLEQQLEYYDSLSPIEEFDSTIISHINDPSRVFKKIYRYVFYCIPSYSNPRGGSYSVETRQKLIELARKHDMLIVCDDVYDLLDYDTPISQPPAPLLRMSYLDRDTCDPEGYGNVISNGTFSKLIGPGLRVGWQETATPKLAFQLSQGGSNKSGGTPAQLNTLIVEKLIENSQLDLIIQKLRSTYSERSAATIDSIKKYLPKDTEIDGGNGGYFIWVTTPPNIDCHKVVAECKERGVILANGDNFEVIGDERQWGKTSVRLSVSLLTKEQIVRGIKIWGDVINDLYSI